MSKIDNRIYFNGLNGIRFIAAFIVILHHIEGFKPMLGFKHSWGKLFFLNLSLGPLGVICFFVLSGFLITYLLLSERTTFSTIDIKKFYLRRILRIWPLYFFILILSFFILNRIGIFYIPNVSEALYNDYNTKLVLFTFMLPNIGLMLYPAIAYISQAWSIGSEEQFYLIWPLLIKWEKKLRPLIWFIIALLVALPYIMTPLGNTVLGKLPYYNFIHIYLAHVLKFTGFVIGGTAAYLLFYQKVLVQKLFGNVIVRLLALLFIIILIFKHVDTYYHYKPYALLCAVIILSYASSKKKPMLFGSKVFEFLGKISYGLYMYHSITIVLVLNLTRKFTSFDLQSVTGNIVVCTIIVLLTIGLSGLSYRFFEKRFIDLKSKFEKTKTSENQNTVEPQKKSKVAATQI